MEVEALNIDVTLLDGIMVHYAPVGAPYNFDPEALNLAVTLVGGTWTINGGVFYGYRKDALDIAVTLTDGTWT